MEREDWVEVNSRVSEIWARQGEGRRTGERTVVSFRRFWEEREREILKDFVGTLAMQVS